MMNASTREYGERRGNGPDLPRSRQGQSLPRTRLGKAERNEAGGVNECPELPMKKG